ncbi:MAG: DUF4810 domain-containing protein [Magnetovibrio sp.]|nr:DUF4810 domain-containing protein [Magnetovibrio sp.]
MNLKTTALVIAITLLTGCARPGLYNWGGYSNSMYTFYKNPEQKMQFTDTLLSVINTNEAAGKTVPPGIYAEYGYMMLETGQMPDAVIYFNKESKAWPEAKPFMETMVKLAKGHPKSTSSKAPIGAADVDLIQKGG